MEGLSKESEQAWETQQQEQEARLHEEAREVGDVLLPWVYIINVTVSCKRSPLVHPCCVDAGC